MKSLKLAFREIRNWFFLRKILERESSDQSQTSLWRKYNLRKNWYGRIYTVVSLREQDMGEEEMVRNWRAMEMMRPINEYLSSLDLQEIIFPSIEQIPDSQSYLVIYSPIFDIVSIGWVLKRLSVLIAIVSALTIFIVKVISK